jgi:hypothetical protein
VADGGSLARVTCYGRPWLVWDIHPDWSKIKFDRMKRILTAKFTQHQDLKDLLLSTGNMRLVESATVDNAVNRLWGEVNGKGKNKLGELLMEVRQELRAGKEREAAVASKPATKRRNVASGKAKSKSERDAAAVDAVAGES